MNIAVVWPPVSKWSIEVKRTVQSIKTITLSLCHDGVAATRRHDNGTKQKDEATVLEKKHIHCYRGNTGSANIEHDNNAQYWSLR